jgi:hypothetical protein
MDPIRVARGRSQERNPASRELKGSIKSTMVRLEKA